MAEPRGHGAAGDAPRLQGHESGDVNVRGIAIFLIGLAVTTGVVLVLMGLLFSYFAAREARRDAAMPVDRPAATQLAPEPLLQTDPRRDLIQLRAEEDSVLSSYAWVDRAGGRVRIPIDRAIEVLAETGLPARPAMPAAEAPRDWSSGRTQGSAP